MTRAFVARHFSTNTLEFILKFGQLAAPQLIGDPASQSIVVRGPCGNTYVREEDDRHGIGWNFWRYKKVESPRGIVSVTAPPHWDEVGAYVKARTGNFEADAKIRPPLAHARAALAGLIENARFRNVKVNEGYVRALGLNP